MRHSISLRNTVMSALPERTLPLLGVLILCGMLLYHSRSIHTVVLIVPSDISEQTRIALTTLCNAHKQAHSLSALSLKQILTEQIHGITQCSIAYTRFHHAVISIYFEKPVLRISESECITDHYHVVPIHYYNEAITNGIPHITTDRGLLTVLRCKQIITWIHQAPPTLLAHYRVDWLSPTAIALRPWDKEIRITFMSWIHTPITETMITVMEQITRLHGIQSESISTGRKKRNRTEWLINMRTPHYAIITEYRQESP
jgi:hypothetical protein